MNTSPPADVRVMAVAIAVLILVMAAGAGATIHSCEGCSPPPPTDLGIDAGPGEAQIAAELDASIQEHLEEIQRIEREHAEELAAFREHQREKYEEVRAQGPDATLAWLSDFNRRLRDAGSER